MLLSHESYLWSMIVWPEASKCVLIPGPKKCCPDQVSQSVSCVKAYPELKAYQSERNISEACLLHSCLCAMLLESLLALEIA